MRLQSDAQRARRRAANRDLIETPLTASDLLNDDPGFRNHWRGARWQNGTSDGPDHPVSAKSVDHLCKEIRVVAKQLRRGRLPLIEGLTS